MKSSVSEINIGNGEVNKRFAVGLIMAILAVIIGVVLAVKNASPLWGIILFFPYLGASLGFLQARKKTCIALAAQGMCNFGKGAQKIEDHDLAGKLSERGNTIIYQSVLIALGLTVASIILLRFI